MRSFPKHGKLFSLLLFATGHETSGLRNTAQRLYVDRTAFYFFKCVIHCHRPSKVYQWDDICSTSWETHLFGETDWHRRTRRLKMFRANSVFSASASCSKILNDKKYLNTVKNSVTTPFSRGSATCWKILNDKKNIFNTVNSWHTLFCGASATYSKLLNVISILNTVKNFWATLFFRART